MNDNNDKLKELFNKVLRNFEEEPPIDMWDRITSKQRRHKKALIWWYSGIAASLLIVIGFGIAQLSTGLKSIKHQRSFIAETSFKQPSEQDTLNLLASTEDSLSNPTLANQHLSDTVKGSIVPSNTAIAESSSNKLSTNSPRQVGSNEKVTIAKNETIGNSDIGIDTSTYTVIAEIPVTSVDSITTIVPRDDFDNIVLDELLLNNPAYNNQPTDPEKAKAKWSLAAGYGTNATSEYSQNGSILTQGGSRYSHDSFSAELANKTSYFDDIQNTVHDVPLSVGILLDLKIGKRWSVETGLLYTRLRYNVKTVEFNSMYREYQNELTYLGIPLGIRYHILDRKQFGLYAIQSVVIEKGIVAKSGIQTYEKRNLVNTDLGSGPISGFQFSTVTTVGGELKVTGNIYLFGQGGIQAFYLNKSQPYNIRSKQIIWPLIQSGLRIKLNP